MLRPRSLQARLLQSLGVMALAVAMLGASKKPQGHLEPLTPDQPASAPASQPTTQAGNTAARNFFNDRYATYKPGYLPIHNFWFFDHNNIDERSSEKSYNNFSSVNEDSRVNAAINVALQRENSGEFREAQPLYQDIIEKMPDVLYRVSPDGVFVRAADYCQMRILGMPAADLAFYRTQYDPRAADAYAEAQRQGSLAGYQEILDTLLATSYGDLAEMALGRAALDTGRCEEAYQRFSFVKRYFAGGHCDTDELAILLNYAARKCGKPAPPLPEHAKIPAALEPLRALLPKLTADSSDQFLRCPPWRSGEDYGPQPVPENKPILTPAVWKSPLPAEWYSREVYSPPVITDDSIVLRQRNIVYCYSLLTGALRWKNDLGGRVVWQDVMNVSTPTEEVVVAGDMVYTNIYKDGPSLAALSLTTGELVWAAGPLAASGQARMRFEAAPAVADGVVYAGYILDNLEGDTHIDTLYGMRAFDGRSGQLLWDCPLSRLPVNSNTATVQQGSRLKIRSFATPPIFRQGMVYYNTNAGTVAAVDARTGRIKWLIRYPYFTFRTALHDMDDAVGAFHFRSGMTYRSHDIHSMLWKIQPPLIYHDCLYIEPVDCPLLMSIELSTGKVRWSQMKGADDPQLNIVRNMLGPGYLVGPTQAGQLVLVYGARLTAATVVDADTGKIEWQVPSVIPPETSPALTEATQNHGGPLTRGIEYNWAHFICAARPTLLADDTLVLSSSASFDFGWIGAAYSYVAARISIPEKKILDAQRCYDAGMLSAAETIITSDAESQMRFFEGAKLDRLKKIQADTVPDNPAGIFEPEQIVTADRFGTVFEVRVAADSVSVAYDRDKVTAWLTKNPSAASLQAQAELAMAAGDDTAAEKLLDQCLQKVLPEQVALRQKIAGLFHSIDLHLSRRHLLRQEQADYLASAGLLLQTSQTLPQEVQSLLAVAEGYERQGNPVPAARILRNVILHFGTHEYAVSPLLFAPDLGPTLTQLARQMTGFMPTRTYSAPIDTGLSLLPHAAPLYTSVISPAETTLTVTAGDLALARLRRLAQASPDVAQFLQTDAQAAFAHADPSERQDLLISYPGTKSGQEALSALMGEAAKLPPAEGRRQMWQLAEIAQRCGFQIDNTQIHGRPVAPATAPAAPAIAAGDKSQDVTFEPDEVLRLVMPIRQGAEANPGLCFIAGRARKRLDNRFTLECFDTADGKKRWGDMNLRLKGVGAEPGFFEALERPGMVIVHGLYDVLAFNVKDGSLLWRYRVPEDFEIRHVEMVQDLLVVCGNGGTLALYIPTTSAVGELVWDTKEEGALYGAPYAVGDRLVMVRQSPDNVTIRRLATGSIVGRMDLPGLDPTRAHPLIDDGPEQEPMAHCGDKLLLSDGWNYILLDTASLATLWKREIDSNDPSEMPAMRIAMNDQVAVVTKKDFDRGSMYGLDLATGSILWRKDVKQSKTAVLYDVWLDGAVACGVSVPVNNSFSVVAFNPNTGDETSAYRPSTFPGMPTVRLSPTGDGQSVLMTVLQGQKLQAVALDTKKVHPLATVKRDGVGPFDVHGQCSATTAGGHVLLLSKDGLSISR